ncbi:MAG: DNA-3-methyladenine glycosylase [Actinobacteria bacterium]|nr:DNA-3-methyladenine glycosylase [Actinomycetota bacterium]MCL5882420.1 DNA-3-methyladenine glycosylase [Actinomycetota bacterium]
MPPKVLPKSFYSRSVHDVAPDLIGCRILHNGVGGIIVETEAYDKEDPACHAAAGMTERNRVMFGPPGRAYVYFTYGMHHLLNIVCEEEGEPAGVLLRALEPTDGVEEMRRRRAPVHSLHGLTNGPGKLAQALGVDLRHYGLPVYRGEFKIYARQDDWLKPRIIATPRIGIRVGTRRKWRYCAADSRFLSRKLTAKGAGQ